MTFEEILTHFTGMKTNGSGQYSADCPACGKRGHLYIAQREKKILLNCKKGCTFGEVVSALGLKQSDFFEHEPKPTLTKLREHIYTDISGNTVAKKTIFSKGAGNKSATWERFESGQFVKGLNGLKVLPYHVHNLKKMKSVVIAEGEKDVETLESMGFCASCSPNGAGSKWRNDCLNCFSEKNVIVLSDNDDVGREFGRNTAQGLIGIAKSVRLIPSESLYPALKAKGDISDIVKQIGLDEAKNLLCETIKKTEPYVAKQNSVQVVEQPPEIAYNADGTGELTIDNLTAYLEHEGISARYNMIAHNIEYMGFNGESEDHLLENAPALIYDKLHFSLKKCTENRIASFLNIITTRNRYNPILEMIDSAQWDKTDRIEYIYKLFGISQSDKLSRTLIRKWLMQCYCGLHNSMSNPFSLDIVLVFQGAQGIGKTRFLEKLAMKSVWFGEGKTFDPHNKDSLIECTSKWICELGEIGSTMRKDINSLKAFLTSSTDEYRQPYGRTRLHYARQTSFCGSTNDSQFLLDETGNRRFATIPIPEGTVIDYEKDLKSFDVLQLWAQVREITEAQIAETKRSYKSVFRLSRDEVSLLESRNKEHLKLLKGEAEILDILSEKPKQSSSYWIEIKQMTVSEFKAQYKALDKYSVAEVGKVLEKLGYHQETKRVDGVPRKVRNLPCIHYYGYQN